MGDYETLQHEATRLYAALRALTACAAECLSQNTTEYMEYLLSRINDAQAALGQTDRYQMRPVSRWAKSEYHFRKLGAK